MPVWEARLLYQHLKGKNSPKNSARSMLLHPKVLIINFMRNCKM